MFKTKINQFIEISSYNYLNDFYIKLVSNDFDDFWIPNYLINNGDILCWQLLEIMHSIKSTKLTE